MKLNVRDCMCPDQKHEECVMISLNTLKCHVHMYIKQSGITWEGLRLHEQLKAQNHCLQDYRAKALRMMPDTRSFINTASRVGHRYL